MVMIRAMGEARASELPPPRELWASRSLRWFACAAAMSACSGTLLYCYARQLGTGHSAMAAVHEVSSDAAMVLLALYLWEHVSRSWRLRRSRAAAWWSGVAAAVAWVAAGASGVYGQFSSLCDATVVWWLHVIGSFAAVVLVCGHAALGFRAQCVMVEGTE